MRPLEKTPVIERANKLNEANKKNITQIKVPESDTDNFISAVLREINQRKKTYAKHNNWII